ncbi:MAG: PKD domain-containing protein, partial [Geobacter sp.]|nr:PKD domain-containing protein [Geobacter sp.]
MKQASQGTWTKLYESTAAITDSPLKVGATVYAGTFDFDNFSGRGNDSYTVTVTVEDGAGQTSVATTTVSVSPNLPPHVITVPWVAHDVTVPHETFNGKAIRLKGIVRDADSATYQWDFGDGTKSAITNVTNAYDLSMSHTYPDAPQGTPFVATLTVWDSKGQSGSDTYNIVVKNKSLSIETNVAIDESLWYLHQQQTRTTSNGYPSGWWWTNPTSSGYYASPTASAIQAFEINGHLENGDHQENPYAETVERGLKYLFTTVASSNISSQTYGNPDTNGNGIGVGVSSSRPIYEGGPVMDAIASSGSALTRTLTGGANIARRTYFDILTDMIDMYAWGQDDYSTGGGWRYGWNDWPDNSAAQWGAIGMHAAEDIFDLPVPQWVKDRNNVWLNTSYNGTGFGYTGGGNDVATTPSGMVQLDFNEKTIDDSRWKTAENYIASQWSPSDNDSVIYRWIDGYGENTRNYYAMYAFTKAMRLANPKPVVKFKANGFDWYHDEQTGIARSIINDQLPDGRISGRHWTSHQMRTAWGVIMLTQTLFVQPPVANAGRDRVWGVNIPLTFDGSGSYHIDPFRRIVKYQWDFNGDGVYDSTGSDPK